MFSEAPDRDLRFLEMFTDLLFLNMNVGRHSEVGWYSVIPDIVLFCNHVNAIQFRVTKKGIKIIYPKRVDLSFFSQKT